MDDIRFRDAAGDDWPRIWPFWHRIVSAGDTYPWNPSTDFATGRSLWMLPPPGRVFVAESGGRVVASAHLKPNQVGLGDHVANAGFMVDPDSSRRGVGRRLAEHVIDEARRTGYRAMQFNAVVESNSVAVRLWQSVGFEILTTVPEAFRHPQLGLVGLHIMYRGL